MGELIDDLLQLSRVSRAELTRTITKLSQIAGTVSEQLKRGEPDRPGEFVIHQVPSAHADARLMRAVLENLLGNAWKFTADAAQPRIEFGAEEREGDTVYFVRDNGVGFDMTYADRLFAPFQRLHTDAEFPGTGIGLATVRRIIDRHGGRVWAEGAVGRGATVFFTVPALRAGERSQ
jgi:light-regulated signal transduction histidine kinase (bacteriophytochrome)